MKNIEIKITKSTRYVDIENETQKVGNEGENLQSNLIFSFTDSFVDGQARLEYTIDGESRYVTLDKIGDTYQTPVKAEMTKKGAVDMQLVITEGTDENEIPKFKSNIFYLPYGSSINAELEEPEEYPAWIDVANAKLNEIDNLDIDATKEEKTTTITITKKDGSKEVVEVLDGEKGDRGEKGDPGAIKIIPVNELPTENIEEDALYSVPNPNSTGEEDKYIEYYYREGKWEIWGSGNLSVDLTDYYTKNETNELLDNKQSVLTAGDNITIEGNVISATGGVSLEEVTAITGNTDELETESKQLVGAINEVLNSSGGSSSPIYTINYNVEVAFSYNKTLSMTDDFIEQLSNILKDAENKGLHDFIVLFNFRNLSVLVKMYVYNAVKTMYVGCPIDNIKANANSNIYVEIIIKRDSEGNISTINSFVYKFNNTAYLLTTENTISYTPTYLYHPATKKYVDDLVGDISTVLATLTTVSEVSE